MRRAAELTVGDKGTWGPLEDHLVFGSQVPDASHPLIFRLCPEVGFLGALLNERASNEPVVDPQLARTWIRAGLDVAMSGISIFAWGCTDEMIYLLRPGLVRREGDAFALVGLVLSRVASSIGARLGREFPVYGEVYEFCDRMAAIPSISAAQSLAVRDAAAGAAMRVAYQRDEGEQLLARLEATRPEAYLSAAGVDSKQLPAWWTHGLAVRRSEHGMELIDPVPTGDAFVQAVHAAWANLGQ